MEIEEKYIFKCNAYFRGFFHLQKYVMHLAYTHAYIFHNSKM